MNNGRVFTPVVAGLIIGVICVVTAILLAATGGVMAGGIGVIQFLVIIIMLVIFIQRYGKAADYSKSFGDLFGYGFKATALITLISLLYLIVYLTANPEVKTILMEETRKQMLAGGSNPDEIKKNLEITSEYFMISAVGSSMFLIVLVGTLGSLAGAGTTRKPPRNSNAIQP